MKIQLQPLSSAPRAELMALMNDPRGVRQMPLASLPFTQFDCDGLLAAKKAMWEDHGDGPWAIWVDGQFAGWGGL